jgi:osmotically inducible protein OsmC
VSSRGSSARHAPGPGERNLRNHPSLLNGMHVPDEIARTAAIVWEGDVAKGHGTITTGSGKIEATYSFGTRFAAEPGTNPEELLGASLAACFTMALAAALTRSGHAPASIDTKATVHLKAVDGGFEIPLIELTTHAVVPGILDDPFQALAVQAKESCPIGKALHAVPVTMSASRS